MDVLYVVLFAFMIVFAFEIRHNMMAEDITALKDGMEKLTYEVRRLREELKMKKNVCEDFTAPK